MQDEASGFGPFLDMRWPDLIGAWKRMSLNERIAMIRDTYQRKHPEAIDRGDLFGEGYYAGCSDVLDALFGEGA